MRRASGALVAVFLLACGPPNTGRERVLETEAARRLVGVWDLSFVADSMSTAFRLGGKARVVSGTIAFTLNRTGADADAALRGITHEGAYDLDFSPLGFIARLPDAPPVAVARVGASARGPGDGDSLWIVLSPESDQFPVRMLGEFHGDSAHGTWSALAFSAGGGTGTFTMRRR